PQQQPNEQIDLPEAAEIEILIPLIAEPEVERTGAHPPVDGEPLAGKGTDHDHEQADEQEVDSEPLELRLTSTEQRRHVDSGGEPGGGDTENGQLRVPGPRDRVREVFGQRQAIETLAFDGVMGRHDPEENLGEE